MDISLTTYLILCPLIFLSGFLDSIAGGGGIISLPAYLLAGLPPHAAIGTNKISATIGVATTTGRYAKSKLIDYKLAVPAMILTIISSSLGAKLVLLVSSDFLNYMMIIVLPAIAALTLKKTSLEVSEEECASISRKKQFVIICLLSLFLGTYSGFYGPGFGTFLILSFIRFGKLPVRTASGTAKLVNLGGTLGALVVFLISGQALVQIGLIAGCFALLGNYIGAGLVIKNGEKIVRPIIGLVLLLMFVKIIYGFFS